ncbi:hypothetical protein MLD38_028283 [Melastoma candidum]|uniref:Uncharacterized protein n=1 Tax=Melastoma candidum TaxID=119954 RepID=A0ACB9N0N0_9MYRT|nr:hypothetical protein MLD38_028283 [Melastoma candidum]
MANVKALAISMVVLRVICIFASAATIAVLVTDQFTDSDGLQTTFKDVAVYRFVLATAVVGAAYALIQMPLAVYFSCTEKRIIRHSFFQEFDFYGDKIISFLLASGVGAGFAYSFEQKRNVNQLVNDLFQGGVFIRNEDLDKLKKFFDIAMVASGLLALAFLCMAIVSICSSIVRSSSRGLWK